MCIFSDENKGLKTSTLVDAAEGKRELLVATVGRGNICFVYLTWLSPQRYTRNMRFGLVFNLNSHFQLLSINPRCMC